MLQRTLLLFVVLLALPGSSLLAEVQSTTKNIGGTTVRYRVVLPDNYDSAKAYPAVLAFPGGGQDARIVDGMVENNFRAEAEKRGYIVVIPEAPNGQLFFQGGERVFPAFTDELLKDYKIEGGKFHIAGISNGGISAFHIAASYPQYFLTLTGFPGYLTQANAQRVKAIAGKCIYMFVGEQDSGWRESMKRQADDFRSQGMKVEYQVEAGQGHVMRTLAGPGSARLFDLFEKECAQ